MKPKHNFSLFVLAASLLFFLSIPVWLTTIRRPHNPPSPQPPPAI